MRLYALYRWCADVQIPELITVAETIETWWAAIKIFLTTGGRLTRPLSARNPTVPAQS